MSETGTDAQSDMWVCEDCGWRWPLQDRGQQADWCDVCEGTMRPVTDRSRNTTREGQ